MSVLGLGYGHFGRGGETLAPPLDFLISTKKVVFFVSREKAHFTIFIPLKEFLKNSLVAPPGNNSSDAHS